jgi:hypothetical protein
MTEEQWLTCTDPDPMLGFLRGKVGDRKLRLFALACCQRISTRIKDERSRAAVEFSERFAERRVARRRGVVAVDRAATAACRDADAASSRAVDGKQYAERMIGVNACLAAMATLECRPWLSASGASGFSANAIGWDWLIRTQPDTLPGWVPAARRPEQEQQAHLLRDIIGNPFRPVALNPAWLTSAVVSIARRAYEERDYQALPILADALEEAGCDNPDILAHCRGQGEHIRGCWVVDMILEKG